MRPDPIYSGLLLAAFLCCASFCVGYYPTGRSVFELKHVKFDRAEWAFLSYGYGSVTTPDVAHNIKLNSKQCKQVGDILSVAREGTWPNNINDWDEVVVILLKSETGRIERISIYQDNWNTPGVLRVIQYRDKVYVVRQSSRDEESVCERIVNVALSAEKE